MRNFVNYFGDKVKAVAAAWGAVCTVVYLAVSDQSVDLNEAKNVIAAIGGLLTAFGITYFSPANKERNNG